MIRTTLTLFDITIVVSSKLHIDEDDEYKVLRKITECYYTIPTEYLRDGGGFYGAHPVLNTFFIKP